MLRISNNPCSEKGSDIQRISYMTLFTTTKKTIEQGILKESKKKKHYLKKLDRLDHLLVSKSGREHRNHYEIKIDWESCLGLPGQERGRIDHRREFRLRREQLSSWLYRR